MARRRVVLTRFKLKPAGIAKIAMSKPVHGLVHRMARDKALPFARSISPRSRERQEDRERKRVGEQKRHYADSFQVDSIIRTDIGGGPPYGAMPRHAARLVNTAPHARWVEAGAGEHEAGGQTVSTRAHRVLGQTLEFLAATKVR